MRAIIRPFTEASTYAVLAFLLTALPLGAFEATALVAGWTLAVSLAITPLVIPVLIGLWGAVSGLARVEREVAGALLGVDIPGSDGAPPDVGFWRRGLAVLSGSAFWRRQAYFLFRFVGGGALAIAELSLLTVGVSGIAAPLIYRWSTLDIGSWHVDTFGRSLLFVPAGIVVLLVAVHLLRPLGLMSGWVARALLAGDSPASVMPPAQTRKARLRALEIHAGVAAAVNLALILIWAVTSRGYFWPVWTLLALALPLAIHAWVFYVDERPELWRRRGSAGGSPYSSGFSPRSSSSALASGGPRAAATSGPPGRCSHS
jgi:hypothetical protein